MMRWLRNLFSRRKTSGAPPSGDSSEDWRPGDLAECINDTGWVSFQTGLSGAPGPQQGEVRVVVNAILASAPAGDMIQYLKFSRYSGGIYAANCFRKITPRGDALERADSDFLTDLTKRPEPVE